MKLDGRDEIIMVLKDVSSDGMRRYFEVYQFDFEKGYLSEITKEVAELTDRKISTAKSTRGCVIVNGVGSDASCELMESMYLKYNEKNGIEIKIDGKAGSTAYNNAPKTNLVMSKRDWIVEKYNDITSKPNVEEYIAKVNVSGRFLALLAEKDSNKEKYKELFIKSLKNDGYAFKYATDDMKQDKMTVLEAVKQNSWALEYASDEIQALCQDKDPVETLEYEIKREKIESFSSSLEKSLSTSQSNKKTKLKL